MWFARDDELIERCSRRPSVRVHSSWTSLRGTRDPAIRVGHELSRQHRASSLAYTRSTSFSSSRCVSTYVRACVRVHYLAVSLCALPCLYVCMHVHVPSSLCAVPCCMCYAVLPSHHALSGPGPGPGPRPETHRPQHLPNRPILFTFAICIYVHYTQTQIPHETLLIICRYLYFINKCIYN